jgi:glutamyl-tRNA synthetase
MAGILQIAIWLFEALPEFTHEAIEKAFRELSEKLDIKLRDLSRPFYVALTGSEASTPLFRSMEILGLDLVRVRLRHGVEALGGISSKRAKVLEKQYRSLFTQAAEES